MCHITTKSENFMLKITKSECKKKLLLLFNEGYSCKEYKIYTPKGCCFSLLIMVKDMRAIHDVKGLIMVLIFNSNAT